MTPNNITELSSCEVFVFGSNLQGHHGGGAARTAMDKFGAQWGVGVGPTGQCYAIPTMQGGVETIEPYVEQFLEYAKQNPNTRFLVTRIGCGIAGFDDMQIAPLFEKAVNLPNVALPRVWWLIIGEECRVLRMKRPKAECPKVWNLLRLTRFMDIHRYEFATGINAFLPDLKVRYIKGRGEFGYAKFGDFFFYKDRMYVWETDDKYAGEHEQGVVEDTFHDECKERGYACRRIYAGVQTNFKDSNGDYIYTGDVLDVNDYLDVDFPPMAVGTMVNDSEESYSFILDNHHLSLDDCIRQHATLTRRGTVFYQVDEHEVVRDANERVIEFNVSWESKEDYDVRLLMTRYTPNFDQERWKYQGLEILGCEEFNWRN